MTRRRMPANALMIGFILTGAHCKPAPEKPADVTPTPQAISAGLGGTSWRLVKFEGGDGLTLTPDERSKYTIAFGADGRLNARIDCNRGSGTWKSSGPAHLEFGPLALTRAMCRPESLHDRIVKHWPYVRSYVIENGHLFISLMADGGIYEFEPAEKGAATPAAVPLENTRWKLTHLGDAPVIASRQQEPYLILNPATRGVGGSGGCNHLGGSYELKGSRLSLGEVISTLMACQEGMETESAFLEALRRVKSWRIAGQELELLNASGKVVARFEAQARR